MVKGKDFIYPSEVAEFDGGEGGYFKTRQPGITLRTELAARAMQALLSNPVHVGAMYARIAKESIQAADALIAELNKTETNV